MNDHPLVELYSKDDCHLCEVAKDVLVKIRERHPFRLIEIKIQPGTDDYETFKEKIPVVFVDKQFVFQHRINEQELVKILTKASP